MKPPGDGYLYIRSMLFYTLFVALIVTLILDLHPKAYQPAPPVAEQGVQPAVS